MSSAGGTVIDFGANDKQTIHEWYVYTFSFFHITDRFFDTFLGNIINAKVYSYDTLTDLDFNANVLDSSVKN